MSNQTHVHPTTPTPSERDGEAEAEAEEALQEPHDHQVHPKTDAQSVVPDDEHPKDEADVDLDY